MCKRSFNRVVDLGECGTHDALICYDAAIKKNTFGSTYLTIDVCAVYVDLGGHLINLKPHLTEEARDDIKTQCFESVNVKELMQ